MGFFSWITSDTQKSIANNYSTRRTFKVHMITEDGQVFTEPNYEGYGVFGGKDFYELIAELNNLPDKGSADLNRSAAIDLVFKDNPSGEYNGKFKQPKIVETLPSKENWAEEWNKLPYPTSCPEQGYFYDDFEDENEENY
jgi:hypothetical protein